MLVIEIRRPRDLRFVYRRVLLILLSMLLLTKFSATTHVYTLSSTTSISATIDSYGLVHVSVTLNLSEGFHRLPLSIEPLIPTISVVCNGEALPVIFDEGHLYLVLNKDAKIDISYIANVSIANNIFYLNLKTNDIIKIEISENVVLLSWPEENIIDLDLSRGILVLYIRGPTTIRYILKQPTTYTPPGVTQTPTPTNTETKTSTPIPTPPHTTNQQTTRATQNTFTPTQTVEQRAEGLPLGIIIVVFIVAVAGAGGVAYYLFARKKKQAGSILDMLSDVDIAIIKALEARGGTALQSELQNDVRVPKTTLWRHIKKLEKLGIVKVEKIGLQNRVVLVKRIRLP